jgi:hypothetical protein
MNFVDFKFVKNSSKSIKSGQMKSSSDLKKSSIRKSVFMPPFKVIHEEKGEDIQTL